MFKYLIILILLFIFELLYFKFSKYYTILDNPNSRSSHTKSTIRGGGIVFPFSCLICFAFFGFDYPFFTLGLIVISIISFLDDVLTLNNRIRLLVHLFSTLLLFFQLDLLNFPWHFILFAIVFTIATINAYNFMDGINGMTGGYSLLTIASLFYINHYVIKFTSSELLIVVGLSLMVFNFFNFRNNAKCFAGDVGSVSIAFIIVFFIGQLVLKTQNASYIFLLLVYGTETAFTVLFRKIRGENIFEAHRSHFYQYLSNQLKYSHLLVSLIYIVAQLLINVILISLTTATMIYSLFIFSTFIIIYLFLRFKFEGRKRLLLSYDKHAL